MAHTSKHNTPEPIFRLQGASLAAVASSATAGAPAAVLKAPVSLAVPIRRVATFHLNSLSGLVFSLPALKALRDGLPGATICSVVRPALAPLLETTGLCDEILRRPTGGLPSQAALMARLAAHNFDIALAFSPSRNTTLLAFSTGAAQRVGFSDAKMEALFTHHAPGGNLGVETLLGLAREIGVSPRQLGPQKLIPIVPEAARRAEKLLEEAQIERDFVVFAPEVATKRRIRAWTNPQWLELARELAASWPLVLVGMRAHPELVPDDLKSRVFDGGARTDLLTLAALLSRAKGVVAPDNGALHLAAALETPVVGLFGPSNWREGGPKGALSRIVRHPVECSPCELARCKWSGDEERKCLRGIAPQAVAQAARELWGL